MPSKPEVIAEKRKNDLEFQERQKRYAKAYREKNREKERERQRISKQKSRDLDKESYNAYMREWRDRNKDEVNANIRERRLSDEEYAHKLREKDRERHAKNPERRKASLLKSTYGLSLTEYKNMYKAQDGKCAICKQEFKLGGVDGLAVDHCHNKGHVRGLLCNNCNNGLGRFKDNTEYLENAINYLRR